ncbi:MAG: metallophosphoesterase [Clostridia bacterium]|nr:metallophosphoesterase [Clostridia bacterium]
MALFALSDPHLSFSTNKPMDIFSQSWENHAEKIRKNWCELVTDEDTVVIPGDISWAMTLDEAREDFAFIDSLPGKKIILKGNHDYWWQSLKKLNEFLTAEGFDTVSFLHNTAIYAEGFIICGSRGWSNDPPLSEDDKKIIAREAGRFELSIKAGEVLQTKIFEETGSKPEILVFSHYPHLSPGQDTSPIAEVLIQHGIKRVFYGHLHGRCESHMPRNITGLSAQILSADVLNFVPKIINI